jgi:hypothetical protein
MIKLKTFSNAPVFTLLQDLALVCQTGTPDEILHAVTVTAANPIFAGKKAWRVMFAKLSVLVREQIDGIGGTPVYNVIKLDGNSKLPFAAFSTLAGVTCDGAGDCLKFCYSFRAWRYPSAFGRQFQNCFLMRFNFDTIRQAFDSMVAKLSKRQAQIDFRLYVDGDFSSVQDVAQWMALLSQFPQVKAYGYSKSFAILLAYNVMPDCAWPSNYLLNISSGHDASDAMVNHVKALPITRGEFIAVSIGRLVKSHEHGTPQVNSELRAAYGKKAFPCHGTCGDCTTKGHACGSEAFRNIPIIIAIH